MSSVNTLRVGQKVVCINVSGLAESRRWLKLNGIYTIAHWTPDGEFVDLLEDPDLDPRRGYDPSRFRPLVTKTQAEDSALFLSIANEAGKPLVTLTDALNRCWLAYGIEE